MGKQTPYDHHFYFSPLYVLSVAQLCLNLETPDFSPLGSSSPWDFPGKNTGGLPFPPPGDLTDPGIKLISPASPALQVDSLLLSH